MWSSLRRRLLRIRRYEYQQRKCVRYWISQYRFATSVGLTVKNGSVAPFADRYHNQTDGMSLAEIVRLAFATNGEIKIARLEVDKGQSSP